MIFVGRSMVSVFIRLGPLFFFCNIEYYNVTNILIAHLDTLEFVKLAVCNNHDGLSRLPITPSSADFLVQLLHRLGWPILHDAPHYTMHRTYQ